MKLLICNDFHSLSSIQYFRRVQFMEEHHIIPFQYVRKETNSKQRTIPQTCLQNISSCIPRFSLVRHNDRYRIQVVTFSTCLPSYLENLFSSKTWPSHNEIGRMNPVMPMYWNHIRRGKEWRAISYYCSACIWAVDNIARLMPQYKLANWEPFI